MISFTTSCIATSEAFSSLFNLLSSSFSLFSSVKKVMYVDYFCKFAVENGFKATEIGKIINKNRNTVVYRRQKCLVYLKDDINRALWQDYKKFMTT